MKNNLTYQDGLNSDSSNIDRNELEKGGAYRDGYDKAREYERIRRNADLLDEDECMEQFKEEQD